MLSFVSEARATCERLAQLDRRCVAFGAQTHRYRFATPVPASTLTAFERRNGRELPPSYRTFLTELGNGGAGPCYGVLPLDLDRPLTGPFPHTEAFERADDDLGTALPGVIVLADQGCGSEILLVIDGPAAGQVWWESWEQGVTPALDAKQQRVTFDRWWLDDMRGVLARFEAVAALMAMGTPHAEIHAQLDRHILQLHIDEAMASLLDRKPAGTPPVIPNKPWGLVCGQVDVLYEAWLAGPRKFPW